MVTPHAREAVAVDTTDDAGRARVKARHAGMVVAMVTVKDKGTLKVMVRARVAMVRDKARGKVVTAIRARAIKDKADNVARVVAVDVTAISRVVMEAADATRISSADTTVATISHAPQRNWLHSRCLVLMFLVKTNCLHQPLPRLPH